MVRHNFRCAFATEKHPWNKFNSSYFSTNFIKLHSSQIVYRPKCVLKYGKNLICKLNLDKHLAELAVMNEKFLKELLNVSFLQRTKYYSFEFVSSASLEPNFSRHNKKILKVEIRPIKLKITSTSKRLRHLGYLTCGDRIVKCKSHPNKTYFFSNTFFLSVV